MMDIGTQLRETSQRLENHLLKKGSILEGAPHVWRKRRDELEDELFNLKIKNIDTRAAELAAVKAALVKEYEKKKQARR